MALKFMVSDYGLHQAHQTNYDRIGKWIVIAALGLGWLVGFLTAVHPVVIGLVQGSSPAGSSSTSSRKNCLPNGKPSTGASCSVSPYTERSFSRFDRRHFLTR